MEYNQNRLDWNILLTGVSASSSRDFDWRLKDTILDAEST